MSKGRYMYRGVCIYCIGYYEPEHRIVWEGTCDGLQGDYHGYTLGQVKALIDLDLEKNL